MKQQPTDVNYQEDFASTAYKLCLAGLDDDGLANHFGVSSKTIQQWRKDYKQFEQCIYNGREGADAQVAAALHKRAIGFKTMVNGKEKYFPPDVKAMELWLKNRQPNHWRDKQQPLEIKRKRREPTDEEIEAELPGLERAYEYAQKKMAQQVAEMAAKRHNGSAIQPVVLPLDLLKPPSDSRGSGVGQTINNNDQRAQARST